MCVCVYVTVWPTKSFNRTQCNYCSGKEDSLCLSLSVFLFSVSLTSLYVGCTVRLCLTFCLYLLFLKSSSVKAERQKYYDKLFIQIPTLLARHDQSVCCHERVRGEGEGHQECPILQTHTRTHSHVRGFYLPFTAVEKKQWRNFFWWHKQNIKQGNYLFTSLCSCDD